MKLLHVEDGRRVGLPADIKAARFGKDTNRLGEESAALHGEDEIGRRIPLEARCAAALPRGRVDAAAEV